MGEGVAGASLATVSGYEGKIELFSSIGYYSGYVGGGGTVGEFVGKKVPMLKMALGLVSGIGWSTFVIGAISSEVGKYYEAKHKKLSVHNTFNSGITRTFKLSNGEFGPDE